MCIRDRFYIEPIIRHGKAPAVYPFLSEQDKAEKIKNELLPFFRAENRNLNAIICKTMEEAKNAAEVLKQEKDVLLMDTEQEQLEFGTYIVTLENSKGLEFDAVILWDFDSYSLEAASLDYKLLYVAMTRALHELHIFSNQPEIARMQGKN